MQFEKKYIKKILEDVKNHQSNEEENLIKIAQKIKESSQIFLQNMKHSNPDLMKNIWDDEIQSRMDLT